MIALVLDTHSVIWLLHADVRLSPVARYRIDAAIGQRVIAASALSLGVRMQWQHIRTSKSQRQRVIYAWRGKGGKEEDEPLPEAASSAWDARIQRIEERVQPALTGLTSGHLEQNGARGSGGVLDCPADLVVGDPWIAIVVERKGQCGIGRWTGDVLRLLDICQGMRVSAGRRTRRGSCSRIADLACSGMRRDGKGTQPGRALPSARELPDARDRRTWARIRNSVRLVYRQRSLRTIRSPAANGPQ